MKVKELIEALQEFDGNTEVCVLRPECEDYEEFNDPDFVIYIDGDDYDKIIIS